LELAADVSPADISSMLDYVAEELSATAGWRRVLEAYASVSAPSGVRAVAGEPGEAAELIVWVPRLSRLDGVEPERLSALHGKLIALGLLSFEVSGKSGMQYQLSPLGRRTLARGVGIEDESSDAAAPDVEDSEDS
jgi:hypothetical protein